MTRTPCQSLSLPLLFRNLSIMVCVSISFCQLAKSGCLTQDFFFYLIAGGVLFKVYIVGETIRVVRRFSLPDVNKRELINNAGVFRFPRVSCAAASADDADLDPGVAGKVKESSLRSCFLIQLAINPR